MRRRPIAATVLVLLAVAGCKHSNHTSNSPSAPVGPPAITSPGSPSPAPATSGANSRVPVTSPSGSDANGDSGTLP